MTAHIKYQVICILLWLIPFSFIFGIWVIVEGKLEGTNMDELGYLDWLMEIVVFIWINLIWTIGFVV